MLPSQLQVVPSRSSRVGCRRGHELRTLGIRVVLVEPGFTRTSFEENLTKPDRSLVAYDSVCAGMEVHMRKGVESGDAPEVVAETVVKAATAAVPRSRIRFRQELAEAQPSAGLMSTSIRSRILMHAKSHLRRLDEKCASR